MAVLPHARHPLVVVDRQHDHRAGVLEDPPVEGVAVGVVGGTDGVLAERDDPVTPIEVLAGRHRPRAGLIGWQVGRPGSS